MFRFYIKFKISDLISYNVNGLHIYNMSALRDFGFIYFYLPNKK